MILLGELWDVIIVGAGLAGLRAAHILTRANLKVVVLEARDRVGGRTLSLPAAPGSGAWGDLGAAWSWPHQTQVRQLCQELGLLRFGQHAEGDALFDLGVQGHERHTVRSPMAGALRFRGGAQALSLELAARLPQESLKLDTSATAVQVTAESVWVHASQGERPGTSHRARAVVLALPPRLVTGTLEFTPDLPPPLWQVLTETPTWMGHAAKVLVEYNQAFWRDQRLSGFAVSRSGPLQEIHDASSPDQGSAALFGFLAGGAPWRDLTLDQRREAVLEQLGRLFGPEALDALSYHEVDWSREKHTSSTQDAVAPQVFPQYGHELFGEPAYEGRVFWAGAETSAIEGGLLEGAVRSGDRAARLVLAQFRRVQSAS